MKVCFYTAQYCSEPIRRVQLGIGYLGAYLQRELPELDIAYALTHKDAIAFNPDVLCVSSTSQVLSDAVALAGKLPKAKKILGGYHVSALPHLLPKEFDIGVVGEGESTLFSLLRLDDWSNVPGTCNKPPVDRLDMAGIPFPYRDRKGNGNEYMFTSRGCPFNCIYCASSRNWGKVSAAPPERVVEEIKLLRTEYKATHITMLDDLFAYSVSRLDRIVTLMEREKLAGQVRFHGFVRANLVSEEMVKLLKRMGFVSVRFGAETMGPELLKFLKNGPASPEDAQRTVDICHKHGLNVGASLVFGSPSETERDLDLTFDFLQRNRGKVGISGFYLLTPYPGTELWDIAVKKGLVSEDMDWSRLSLDFLKPEFDWRRAVYMNADVIPVDRFKQIVHRFRSTFLKGR